MVQKSRSFPGFASSTLLLLHSRIKRDFRPPKIGNRTSRYFTPWNGPNPPAIVHETLEQGGGFVPLASEDRAFFFLELGNFLGRMNTGYYQLDQTENTFLVGRISFLLRGGWPMEIWNGFNKAEGSWIFSGIHAGSLERDIYGSVFWLNDRDRFFFWRERGGDKRKGGIDIGSLNIFLGNRRWNRIENRRSESIVFGVEKFINI